MEEKTNLSIFRIQFKVPAEAIDANGHVNNVYYVQWMQDLAVNHYESIGGVEPTQALGATWVVRSHHVVYQNPAFKGDLIEASTWVVNIRKVRSLRRYQFARVSDGKVLVNGETDWVFVDNHTGRLLAIPPQIAGLFTLLEE
ncbi:MAG: acyl-CoA thioesterase [Chloroflexota bacterium]